MTGEKRDTLQFEDDRAEMEIEEDIIAPNSQQASTDVEERVMSNEQDIGVDEHSPPQPPPTQDANKCAAPHLYTMRTLTMKSYETTQQRTHSIHFKQPHALSLTLLL